MQSILILLQSVDIGNKQALIHLGSCSYHGIGVA
jgi:hypothetical protein